jgi:P27 family predicted phage terminase small subunit
MPPRGRPPKPREQKIAEGNPGKRPLPETYKMPGGVVTPETFRTPPEHLTDTAKEWWLDAVPVLQESGMLEKIDRPMLEFAAIQYARARQASRMVEDQGLIAKGSTGQLKEHPLLETERKAMTAYLRFIEQFAGTPQARVRLGLDVLKSRSLAEELRENLGTPHLEEVDEDQIVEAEVVA